jgi:hypothetical protein
MFPVKPVAPDPAPPARSLAITNGRFFSYALPQGWRVGEDSQFALTLAAPDNKAFTVMVGNAGLPVNYPPGQFVFEKLSALRPENLQIRPGHDQFPLQFIPLVRFADDPVPDPSSAAAGTGLAGFIELVLRESMCPLYLVLSSSSIPASVS